MHPIDALPVSALLIIVSSIRDPVIAADFKQDFLHQMALIDPTEIDA